MRRGRVIPLKVKKVGKVEYAIDMDKKPDKIRFLWKRGKLYITVDGIVLNSDESWYEIPVDTIRSITVDDTGVMTIDFETGVIRITSKDVNSLRAMRHFILPYIR